MSEVENSTNNKKTVAMDINLDDDKSDAPKEFSGATLAMANGQSVERGVPEVNFSGGQSMPELNSEAGGLSRDRPFSASMRSTASTKSVTSMKQGTIQTAFSVKTFFAYRNGGFEAAVETLEPQVVKRDVDGTLRGAWLLMEIDHWDHEREKVVMLTDNSLLVCRYDFIGQRLLEHRRVMLHGIDALYTGDFMYPKSSFMPVKNHGGVKISWAKDTELSFGQKWNPFCTDIPYLMFAHHPIIYHDKERETVTYNVDDFFESLVQAVNQVYRVKNPGKTVTVLEESILIESYASLSSQIFNQSALGFFKERGGVSF